MLNAERLAGLMRIAKTVCRHNDVKPRSVVVVVAFVECSMEKKEIAEIMGVSVQWVRRLVARFEESDMPLGLPEYKVIVNKGKKAGYIG